MSKSETHNKVDLTALTNHFSITYVLYILKFYENRVPNKNLNIINI